MRKYSRTRYSVKPKSHMKLTTLNTWTLFHRISNNSQLILWAAFLDGSNSRVSSEKAALAELAYIVSIKGWHEKWRIFFIRIIKGAFWCSCFVAFIVICEGSETGALRCALIPGCTKGYSRCSFSSLANCAGAFVLLDTCCAGARCVSIDTLILVG